MNLPQLSFLIHTFPIFLIIIMKMLSNFYCYGGLKIIHTALQLIILFILFYFIFKLYNIALVLPNIEMNPPQVYMCSPS